MKKALWLLLLPLLSGCWDVKEPERMYYILGLGIDYKDNEYEVYAQIIDFSNIAKSEQPNPEAIQAEIGSSKGRTVEEAFFKMYKSMDERLFWGHLSYVIFSENALKENVVKPVIEAFIRYRELRYTTWVYTTQESIEDILLLTPIINKSIALSKLSDPLNSYNQNSFIRPVNFRELTIDLDEPSHEVAIPYIKIEKGWKTEKGEDELHSLTGVGVLSKDGLEGYILDDDAVGLQWMNNNFERGEITFEFSGYDEPYVSIVVEDAKSKVTPIVENGQILFDIEVKLKVQSSESNDTTDEKMEQLQRGIEKKVKQEIEKTYTASLEKKIDIYRLSEVAFRKKLKVWKDVEEEGKVPLTESSIRNLNVSIERLITERTSANKQY